MVSSDELINILKKVLANQEKLTQEIEELRSKNKSLTTNHKQAILHAMSPKEKEAFEKEELLSSPILDKCVDLIIRDAKRSPRFR